MKEEEFKRLRTEVLRKAGLVNMALRKKKSLAEALRVNNITEENFNLLGWQYNKETNLIERHDYVSFDDIKDKFPEENNVISVNSDNLAIGNVENKNKLDDFLINYEIIMQMVQTFKENKQVNLNRNSIIVELPTENNKSFKASYRVNETIHKQFKEFCKQHKEFTAKDLLSEALKEFMEKYK